MLQLVPVMNEPRRIVVELVSSADVRRLEDRDEELRAEIKRLERIIDGMRQRNFELMQAIGDLRRGR